MLITTCQYADLNDATTLQFFTEMVLFKEDKKREVLIFPSTLTPPQRRIVHTLSHHMNLQHVSRGEGAHRQVHVYRDPQAQGISPPIPQVSALQGVDASRRGLNRAATIDFNEARSAEPGVYNTHNTLRGQQSSGLLGIPDSPGGFGAQQNLRAAKSVADLRSYTPSPVPSTASFPPNLQSNTVRYQDYGPGSAASATPTLTPTASGSVLGQYRDDGLVNGFSNLTLGGHLGPNGGSPRRLRGAFSWDQDNQQVSAGPSGTGPIGSNRSVSINYDNSSQDRGMPLRQPRGPSQHGPPAFSRGRQNGHQARGSDELRQQPSGVEIIVE